MSEMLILQLQVAHRVFKANTEGVSQEESLAQPAASGNSLNWIAGHLVTAYNDILLTLGEEPVWDEEKTNVYKRGTEPQIEASRAMDFRQICSDFSVAHERVLRGIGNLAPERWLEPAPYSPGNNPEETLGTLLHLIAFHQAYHVGQLGLGRRLVGKAGAIG